MKKLLIIIGAISLITSGSSNLIACNKNNNNESKENNKPKTWNPQEPPENSNWKLILDYYSEFSDLSLNQININNMWYLSIIKKDDNNYYLKKFKNNHKNITGNHWNNGIAINHEWFRVPSIYRWELKIEPTELPKIDKGTGKILNWNIY